MEVLDESHSDDITSIKFCSTDKQRIMSCSTDNLLTVFNFEGKSSMKEDDAVESVYCSEQPLLDCGFIGSTGTKAYALTSINSLEIIDLQDEDQ